MTTIQKPIYVPEKVLYRILEMYKMDRVHLRSAEVFYPNGTDIKYGKGRGLFRLGSSQYNEDWPHMTAVQALECIEQLSYTTFGQLIHARKLNRLEDLTLDEFIEKRKRITTVGKPNIDLQRQTSPNESFYGEIKVVGVRRNKESYLTRVNFSLNQGAIEGELMFKLFL